MKLQMITKRFTHLGVLLGTLLLLSACGDGGGGAAAPQVDPGPPPPSTVTPPPDPLPAPSPVNNYADALEASAVITGVEISSPPVLQFVVTDEHGQGLTGLTAGNIRVHIAKLVPAENGNSSYWQSYINRLKTPNVVPTNDPAIQATSERGSSGTLVDHDDGTYTYTFGTDITAVTSPMAVSYEPTLTHRIGMQFSGGVSLNPTYDWVPATNETSGIELREVVAIESCNSCHNPLRMHGGGRFDTKLCVVCHNPGTTEPNSLTSMDMKVMVHKIHMGRELPSVEAGGEYVVYGYRDSKHDYSEVGYPGGLNNCAKCHVGSTTADNPVTGTLTSHGDNWANVPTIEACGSCHDNVDFSLHAGGQTDNSGCVSCHSTGGIAGSVESKHLNEELIAGGTIDINVSSVTSTAPGEFPVVTFSITDPTNGDAPYDVLTDSFWTDGRLRLALAWNTDDFTTYQRTSISATNTVNNGDGSFTVTSEVVIPDGSAAPFRAATGSGMVIFEGRAEMPLPSDDDPTNTEHVPFVMDPTWFSIDEADGMADARRQVVAIETCNACHDQMAYHGGNRTNTEHGCQGCHNPRDATSAGESIDFKRIVHAIHGAGIRDTAINIRSRTEPFTADVVHFPGEIADCHTCHVNDSFELPLASGVLASTRDMGADEDDPADDLMITPTAAVCSSCHDNSLAQSHMEQNGADFSATEASIAAGVSTETCEVCHGPGRSADVQTVHHDPQPAH